MIRAAAVAVGIALVAAACTGDGDSGGEGSAATSTSISTISDTTTSADATTVEQEPQELALVDSGAEVTAPMDAATTGESLLVAERAGRVLEVLENDSGDLEVAGVVVDLTDEVGSTDTEKGLLGVTTDTDGRRLFLNHTRADDGATVIVEYQLTGTTGSLSAENARELLVIDQPFANHNGGDIAWGPDAMLWIGTGDGGSPGDPDGRAQRLSDPLGKILRLDPSLDGEGEDLAPQDNPYADGAEGANPLVWARGLRNPWRISFDDATGDLWIADVGQNEVEEVSVLRADDGLDPGADLGWDRLEGDREFADAGPTSGWPDDSATVLDPLFTYTHDDRCSISGGYVYRGDTLASIEGDYLFSDYCDGRIRALSNDGAPNELELTGDGVVSINADTGGEPLVLGSSGISRIVAA